MRKSYVWTKTIVDQLNELLNIADGYSVAVCLFAEDVAGSIPDSVVMLTPKLDISDFCGWCIVKKDEDGTVTPVTQRVDTLKEFIGSVDPKYTKADEVR